MRILSPRQLSDTGGKITTTPVYKVSPQYFIKVGLRYIKTVS